MHDLVSSLSGISLILMAVLLYVIFTVAGARARRQPWIFLLFGVLIAYEGITVNDTIDNALEIASKVASINHVAPPPPESHKAAELAKKLVQAIFIAAGAGLIGLSINISSQLKLDDAVRDARREKARFEQDWKMFVSASPAVDENATDRRLDRLKRLQIRKLKIEKRLDLYLGEGHWEWENPIDEL